MVLNSFCDELFIYFLLKFVSFFLSAKIGQFIELLVCQSGPEFLHFLVELVPSGLKLGSVHLVHVGWNGRINVSNTIE